MRPIFGALALSLAVASPAAAWGWLQTPEAFDPAPAQTAPDFAPIEAAPTSSADGICIAAILAAEARFDIPDHLLLALGLQEAGYKGPHGLTIWPWSVNAAGEGRRFNSRTQAEAFVRQKQAMGVELIDVGCLQINLRWHPEAFDTLTQGFDPTRNVAYAARFLRELYEESGDWWVAAGNYHSRSPGPQQTYLTSLKRNLQVAQARFGQFAAMAEGIPLPETEFGDFAFDTAPATRHREPTPYRTEGAIWGAEIAGDEGARRSLYSALDLEPVLPTFLDPEI